MSAKRHLSSNTVDINSGKHPLKSVPTSKARGNDVTIKKRVQVGQADFVDPLSVIEDLSDYNDDVSANLDVESRDHQCEENDDWNTFSQTYIANVNDSSFVRVSVPQPLHYLLLSRDSEKSYGNSPESRLAWLEANNGGDQASKATKIISSNGMSSSEFSTFMETCTEELSKCWKDDQRVQVVKLSIQLATMLASADDFLSSDFDRVFFAVTDILSFFGQLVYDRLVAKSPGLKINFSLDDVTLQARELCKNWLYKIASIRELVPRFYLETALLKCYRFSCDMSGYPALLERLTLMIRGMGNPRAASFARIFLLRSACQALGTSSSSSSIVVRQAARLNYEEFLRTYRVHRPESLECFKLPAAWLVQMLYFGLNPDSGEEEEAAKVLIIKKCFNELDDVKYPGIILDPLIQSCPSALLQKDLTWLAHVISVRLDEESSLRFTRALHSFLKALQRCIEEEQQSVRDHPSSALLLRRENLQNVLQQCWMLNCQRFEDPLFFLQNVKIFFILWCQTGQNSKIEEACSTLLSLSLNGKKVMSFAALTAKCKEILADVISSILQYSSYQAYHQKQPDRQFGFPFTNPGNFVALFECLELPQRERIARQALDELPSQPDGDPIISMIEVSHQDLLLRFAQVLSSTVNALTIADEVRQISQVVGQVVDLIDCSLGHDYEKRLKFYTESRELFKRMESVQYQLVDKALNLAMTVRQRYQAVKMSRFRGFLQACVAFAYITIPSISYDYLRLQTYLQTCQVAFQCHCIGQAEASVEAIISSLQQQPLEGLEGRPLILSDFLPSFLSFVILLPSDSPNDLVTTKLIKLTLKTASDMASLSSPAEQLSLMSLIVKSLHCLKTLGQERYPYHIEAVASNDTLWFHQNQDFPSRTSFRLILDLLDLIISRLEYFYQQNMATTGNFIVVQVLIFLKTLPRKNTETKTLDSCQETLEALLNKHDQQVDKKTKFLLKYYREQPKG